MDFPSKNRLSVEFLKDAGNEVKEEIKGLCDEGTETVRNEGDGAEVEDTVHQQDDDEDRDPEVLLVSHDPEVPVRYTIAICFYEVSLEK